MANLSQLREQIIRDYFPHVIDLHTQVQLSSWSFHQLIPRPLLALLPFGRTLDPIQFDQYLVWVLPEIVEASRRSLLYWTIISDQDSRNLLDEQVTIFFNETFFWHYYIAAKVEETTQSIQNGNRVRFLSRFHLSQTQIELEFNEVKLVTTSESPQLVYTDSEERIYMWSRRFWHIHNLSRSQSLLNPQEFTIPPFPNTSGRDTEYQETLRRIVSHPDDIHLNPLYWDSNGSTQVNTPDTPADLPDLTITRASTPESEYCAARVLPPPPCFCGIDVCMCNRTRPSTPPTPPYIFLWDPREFPRPRTGLHYQRHAGFTQSG